MFFVVALRTDQFKDVVIFLPRGPWFAFYVNTNINTDCFKEVAVITMFSKLYQVALVPLLKCNCYLSE